jgi:signal transduction histidine kinase
MILELSQRAVSVEPELIGVFFDGASTLHPGGASSAIRLAAAARIFRAHGGRADVRRDTPVGCTVTFVLPQAVARTPDV